MVFLVRKIGLNGIGLGAKLFYVSGRVLKDCLAGDIEPVCLGFCLSGDRVDLLIKFIHAGLRFLLNGASLRLEFGYGGGSAFAGGFRSLGHFKNFGVAFDINRIVNFF